MGRFARVCVRQASSVRIVVVVIRLSCLLKKTHLFSSLSSRLPYLSSPVMFASHTKHSNPTETLCQSATPLSLEKISIEKQNEDGLSGIQRQKRPDPPPAALRRPDRRSIGRWHAEQSEKPGQDLHERAAFPAAERGEAEKRAERGDEETEGEEERERRDEQAAGETDEGAPGLERRAGSEFSPADGGEGQVLPGERRHRGRGAAGGGD